MRSLEKLLEGVCPKGVEYRKIKDIYTRQKGTPITAGKMKEIDDPDGDIRIFAGGKTIINAMEKGIPKANITRVPAVLVQSRGVIDFVYYDRPFTFKNEMWAYTSDNAISVKYLYHILKNNILHFREAASGMGSLPQISLSVTEEFLIPIPPLPVQGEIVRILDLFSKLIEELNEGLSSELAARKAQYEYYKDSIFSRYLSKSTRYAPLSQIADVRDGTHDSPKPSSDGKYLLTSKNVKNGTINYDNAYFISRQDFDAINQRSKVDIWDLLFTMIGTVGEVGIIEEEPDFAIKNVGLIKTGDELLSRFLRYYLTTSAVKKYVRNNKSKGSQLFLALGKLRNIPIPVLERKAMEETVGLLKRFDGLCTDMFCAIPVEIEARQKQYAYYRDKLLAFKGFTGKGGGL